MAQRKRSKTSTNSSLHVLSNPRYKGKHVVIVKNRVFNARTGQEAAKIFKQVIKKYPREKPLITFIPKEDMLILVCSE